MFQGSGTGVDLEKRIEQVFGYLANPARNGKTFDCPNHAPANQGNSTTENGFACSGALASDPQHTPTTIFKSNVEPPIIWFGANFLSYDLQNAPVANAATYGWSGRMKVNGNAAWYSQHLEAAKATCDAV